MSMVTRWAKSAFLSSLGGITELDIQLVTNQPPLPPMVLAQDQTSGANATLGGRAAGCFKNPLPVGGPAKVILKATSGGGVSLYAVDGVAAGLTRTPLATMDQTRKQAKLEFNDVEGRLVGTEGAGWDVLGKVLDLAVVALAAEQVGGAQFVLEMAVQYAKDRVQFGRPIGSFQAVAHRCADMRAEIDACRTLALRAAWALQHGDDAELAVASALAYAKDALRRVAMHAHQVHGAIGFSTEHDLHIFTRRIKAFELDGGSTAHYQERLAAAIGLEP